MAFLIESLLYLLIAGVIQFVGGLLLSPLFFFVARRFSREPVSRLSDLYFNFNFFLLLWGCVGNWVFMSIAYDRFYVSQDTVIDWFAFIPFGQWVLNQTLDGQHAGYLTGGATLWQLRLIWFAVAAPVWLLAYASTVASVYRCLPLFPRFHRTTHAA